MLVYKKILKSVFYLYNILKTTIKHNALGLKNMHVMSLNQLIPKT